MKHLWSYLVLLLLEKTNCPYLYSWNPHPWFYLVMDHHEEELLDALEFRGVTMYKIIGGDSYLDHWPKTFAKRSKRNVFLSFGNKTFEPTLDLYYSAIGDYLISAVLSQQAVRRIESLYKNVLSYTELEISTILELFSSSLAAKLTLEYNPKKARLIATKFNVHFRK